MRATALSCTGLCVILSLIYSVNAQQDRPKDKYEVLKEEWCGKYNCYELLDVTPDVEFREIKQKYNNLSLILHPDKNVNATDEEKERYVRINKAYEILSSKRRDYDEYLRIKVSMDSPVESPIVVLILLYFGIAYAVLNYQRQQQKKCKAAILQNAQVIRYYWEERKIDLTGKKKAAKSPRKKGKKKKVPKPQSVEQIKENIDIDELNDVISKLDLLVPGYKSEEPTYKQALFDVFNGILWGFGEIIKSINWFLKYNILKQDYSDEDRVILCRKHHKMSKVEWDNVPEQDRNKLLKKPGPWRNDSKKKRN